MFNQELLTKDDYDENGRIRPEVICEITDELNAIRTEAQANGTYLKAPNGQPSNLEASAWELVRTKRFKNWFGDWEKLNAYNYATKAQAVETLTGEEFAPDGEKLTLKVTRFYKEKYNGEVENPLIGKVKIDLEGVKSSLAHGIGRVKAAAFIAVPSIIKKGVLLDYQSNRKRRGYDSVAFVAPITIGGERYIGEVVVNRHKNSQVFYLQVEIQKKTESAFKTSTEGGALQPSCLIISSFAERVKNSSKLLDENGEPKVMYHGTPDGSFVAFRPGAYFSSEQQYADRYQNPSASSISTGKQALIPQTFAVFLDIKKPFDLSAPEARRIYIEEYVKGGNAIGINPYLSDAEYAYIKTIDWTEGEDLKEFLQESDYVYDGIVLDEGGDPDGNGGVIYRGNSYLVFNPNQIKSVDNRGTFDAGENIFYQEVEYERRLNEDIRY